MSDPIEDRVFDLYDTFCHSDLGRREFLRRAAGLGVTMALSLLPDHAKACQVSFNHERIRAEWVRFPSPSPCLLRPSRIPGN